MDDKTLGAILEYQMTPEQAKAYKLVWIYINLSQKYLSQSYKLPKGDPRKCELFRYCYKLVREVELRDFEYKLYIRAQFDLLTNIRNQDGQHSLITPNCLVGQKAWNRWLKWKSILEKFTGRPTVTIKTDIIEVERLLKRDKQYLFVRFDRLNKEDIRKSLENGDLFRWADHGFISKYYLALSPIVQDWYKSHNKIVDTVATQEDMVRLFQKEFSHEL